jgi:dGTPase
LGIFLIGNGKKYKDQLTAKEWQDLIDFEGEWFYCFDGVGQESREVFGSFATLGALMKYPKESLPKKPTTNIADKKVWLFKLIRYSLKK